MPFVSPGFAVRRIEDLMKRQNEARCGEIAYAAEFIDAFEWWLKESRVVAGAQETRWSG
jgi:hypothetical protein